MLERIYGGTLAERRPNIHVSLQMRKEPLRVLHRQQISLLREWRPLRDQGDAGARGAPPSAAAHRQRHRQRPGRDGVREKC